MAAWAEFRYGAARDADESMVMVTIGTGIGGGIVLGGKLVPAPTAWRPSWDTPAACRTGGQCGCGRWAAWSSTPAAAPWCAAARDGPGRSPTGPPRCWNWPAGRPRRSPARWSPRRPRAAIRRLRRGVRRRSVDGWAAAWPTRADRRPASAGHRRRRGRCRRPVARADPAGVPGRTAGPRGSLPIAPRSCRPSWATAAGVVGAADLARYAGPLRPMTSVRRRCS